MQRLDVIARQLTAGIEKNLSYGAEKEKDRKPLLPTCEEYERLWRWSVNDPAGFWGEQAKEFFWHTKVGLPGT